MADRPEICWRKNWVQGTSSRRLVFAMVLSAIVLTRGLWPQETQERRGIMVKAALNDLRSADPKVVSNAAVQLGEWRIKAAVPALLEVLQSPRSLRISEHVTTGKMRRWLVIDPKWRIVEALGAIGDKRAVPLLERYLRAPPAGLEMPAQNLASALFLITGVRYRYRDDQGNLKRYAPGEFEEEEVRRRFRPDLVPVGGLTAALEVMATGPLADDSGSWLGSQPLIIEVSITNHSGRATNISLSADRFVFSSLSPMGVRTNTRATDLPGMQLSRQTGILQPGATTNIKWTIERLATSTISRGWPNGYVNIKCVYRPYEAAVDQPLQVVSNSVARYYFATD